jgi:micrococcal nuclease
VTRSWCLALGPETVDPRKPVQYFGKESSAFNARLLLRKAVRLEYDQQRTDKYRRTLAYLYLADGTLANSEIIRQGYGHALLSYPFSKMEAFREAEREAREAKRGLWANTEAQTAQQRSIPAATIRVWVNTKSRVYHCPGSRYYGATKSSVLITQEQAIQAGNRAANGRRCQ